MSKEVHYGQTDQDQARGSQHRRAPNNSGLPRHQENEPEPKEPVGQCGDLGRDWRAGSKGEHAGRCGRKNHDKQCEVRAATRTSETSYLADPAPDHDQPRSGKLDAPGRMGGGPQGPAGPVGGKVATRGDGGNTT